MRSEILKTLNLSKFFNIVQTTENIIKYTLEKPSRILLENIHTNWLRSILAKTQKHMPVFLNEKLTESSKDEIPYGYINHKSHEYDEQSVLEHNLNDCRLAHASELKFNLMVPEQDVMQYFIQWQRYRKYWWSSVTTTPSLFAIGDIKYDNKGADVDIVAKFPWGQHTVETVTINSDKFNVDKTSQISCSMTLETALFILLFDGLTNTTKDEYLRLHRKMAPYKFSFALENASNKQSLEDLATLLHQRLELKKISNWLPDFSSSIESQLRDNLQLGIGYTIILSESTLTNGILHLMNSCTTLREQVHVADLDSYAALICGK